MSETRATIRQRAQRIVGTAVNQTLNDAIKEAHKKLQRKHNYSWMEYNTTVAITESDSTFLLPADFKAIANPEMSDEDGTGYQRMKGIIKRGIESRSTTETGRPMMFRIWLGLGHLYNVANQNYTFRLEYYRWLPEPPTDDKEYNLDSNAQYFLDEVYEYIYYFAVARGYDRLKKYDLAAKWDARAEAKRLELEDDDIENSLAGIDLKMELPG